MTSRFVVALAVLVASSACLGATTDPPEGTPVADECAVDPFDAAPEGVAHDHANPSHHEASCGFVLRGHESMVTEEGDFGGAHAVDTHGTLAAVAVRSASLGHGFNLYDVSDPTQPTLLSEYRNDQARGGDRNLAFSGDGRYVFLGSEGDQPDDAGVWVVEVSDPASPRDVTFTPLLPYGVHTLDAFAIGTTQYVAAINFGVNFLELRDLPTGLALVPLSRFEVSAPDALIDRPDPRTDTPVYLAYGHDVLVKKDEASGRMLAYFAHIYAGAYVLDVTDPRVPVQLLRWYPPGDAQPYVTHAIDAYVDDSGRRILVVGEETFLGRDEDRPSQLWFVDATDFASPMLLGTWNNPGDHPAGNILFSLHYFQAVGTNVYLSHYHGGVWRLDASYPEGVVADAFYMPHEDTGYVPAPNCCFGKDMVGIPMTFDVRVDDRGVVYAADLATGFYVLADSNSTV